MGPAIARVVAAALPVGGAVEVRTEEDPTALLDLWEGHDHVVVVDAVVTGDPAGTLHRLELGTDAPSAAGRSRGPGTGRAGTHAFGLATAVELGRALGRLPARVVVVGVEAGNVDLGDTLSPAVAAVVDAGRRRWWREEVAADVPG